MSEANLLVLDAESIVSMIQGKFETIVLVKPSKETLEMLKVTDQGKQYDGVKLLDLTEGGAEDTRLSMEPRVFLQAGLARQEASAILVTLFIV